ncbi:MAG: type II toxin-antitoxin system VapC family toxin [Thermoproteales archaeon]|nr:type II toxin-antitoxin system VapC family toxin [Thermoproteales archaeon]
MRFVDASVFVHAFLKPRRRLKPHEVDIKEAAKAVVRRINEGEEVGLTVVQLAEIANILERYMPLEKALQVEKFLLYAPNVEVYGVDRRICVEALKVAEERGVGLSDAIAYVVMLQNNVKEIYSFDRDFDRLEGVERVPRRRNAGR